MRPLVSASGPRRRCGDWIARAAGVQIAAPPGRNGAVAFWLKEIDDLLGEYLEGVHVGVVTPGHRRVHFIADGLEPAFSPDGRTLAMSDGPSGGLVLRRLDGTRVRSLTRDADHAPAWSPSGREVTFARLHCVESDIDYAAPVIAFVRSQRPYWLGGTSPGERGIHVVSSGGGPSRQLVARGASPDWSPRGDRLVFRRRTGRHWALFVVNADGSGLRRVLATRKRLVSPIWAPDGRSIAFLQNRDVFSISPTGTNYRRLLPHLPCRPGNGASGADGIAWQPLRPL